tara:strand:- start:1311 stop:1466 length:156 start_codon:yes stop_codon:yes gene_type:complete
MLKKIKAAAVALLLLALFGLVGEMDYQDAVAQHEHCLKMVEQGAWPPEVCQ